MAAAADTPDDAAAELAMAAMAGAASCARAGAEAPPLCNNPTGAFLLNAFLLAFTTDPAAGVDA